MKKSWWLILVSIVLTVSSAGAVAAQTIDKSSVQVRLQVHKGYNGDPETWSWTPVLRFRVNGPISPGSAFSVEYNSPAKAWKFDCQTDEYGAGWLGARDCGMNPPDNQAVTYTGPVDFKNNFIYYVNYDWALPIAYVYDEWVYNWEYPGKTMVPPLTNSHLMAAFWFRGTNKSVIYSKYAAYLYFNGQMVAEAVPESAVCEVLNQPESNQDSPNAYCRSVFTFNKAILWDKQPGIMEAGFYYEMYKHPGEYEIKVLQNGKLARSAKFTFGADYKIADNGIVKQNSLG